MLEIFTFGDSWTSGCGLQNPKTEYFGAVLADKLNACVHNYGVEGSSVSGALNLIEENLQAINQAESALVILTFTENARDIDCFSERHFDYISAYKDCNFDYNFYNRVLDDIEQEWIDRLGSIGFGPNVKVITGFNFAQHNILDKYCRENFIFIDQTWLQLLGYSGQIPRTTRVSALAIIHELTEKPINDEYKRWAADTAQPALDVFAWGRTNSYMVKDDSGHPNKDGHNLWAERILCEL